MAQASPSQLDEAQPCKDARTAVDIGCGTGACALLLAKIGLRVTAVDGAESMLSQARQNCRRSPPGCCERRPDRWSRLAEGINGGAHRCAGMAGSSRRRG
ncbi:class I SAM-dependent methyltransferase [Aliirhizobium terrae]|uniref:methyltransferase domain-containing protein n=1 Tax=Terrirhizobium terrae TaxID=2926709 RepID=UPI002577C3BD|nr:class I SAM-dependent methyltransferase [Rhizobium sp. CC-CFT758]WJH41690.1 class I SAM-dependent methyltransferase [Rhizobium sp. CC-CFT758]